MIQSPARFLVATLIALQSAACGGGTDVPAPTSKVTESVKTAETVHLSAGVGAPAPLTTTGVRQMPVGERGKVAAHDEHVHPLTNAPTDSNTGTGDLWLVKAK